MIGKLINNEVVKPSAEELTKIIIANPTEEILKVAMGYKEIIVGEVPKYNEETQYLMKIYEENKDNITIIYEIHNKEEIIQENTEV